jgi:hypothetical protein
VRGGTRFALCFPISTVLPLALGVGATTGMFSIDGAWLLEPWHFPYPGRLAIGLKAEVQRSTGPKIFIGFRDFEAWAGSSRSFTSLAAVLWLARRPLRNLYQ